ncbi:MAG: hypothetical protein GF421_03620 [Candidatus Aminicenantes bacterium]|nr:hypothetical protein [Candidatus Aminicenantes bacterium]
MLQNIKSNFLKKHFAVSLLLIFIFSLTLKGQVLDSEEQKDSPVYKILEPLVLDGKLEEPVWRSAPEANRLLYVDPGRSDPSQVRTSVKILYDASHIYIGFSCFDSNPSFIRGEMTIKDADIRTDDSVYILIESIHDDNYYYFFGTNLRGAHLDAKVSKDGSVIDPNWDGLWEASTALLDKGWSAEISIDLIPLKYEADVDHTLGLSFSRVVPRLDSLLWSGPLDPIFNLDEPQLIKNIELLARWKSLHFSTHILPGYVSGEKAGLKSAGIDAAYSPHKNFSSSVTLNPDFATTEPVDEKLNLTMFELYLTDKRPFFFKDTKAFDPDFRLYYPRRISDIYGGMKFNIKAGGMEVYGISTQTQKKEQVPTANYSFVKLNAELMRSFNVSLTASNRLWDNQNTGAAAANMEWNPFETITIAGQFSLSYGSFSEDNTASMVKLHWDLSSFYFHLGLRRIEKHYWENANQVGYILDDDRQEIQAWLGKSFPCKVMGINTIEYDSYYDVYWSTEGILRSWQIDQTLAFHFRDFWKLSVFHTRDYKLNALFPKGVVTPGGRISNENWNSYLSTVGPLSLFDPDYVFNLLNPVIGKSYKIYVGSQEYNSYLTKVTSGFYKGKGNTFSLALGMGKLFAQKYEYYEAFKDFVISQKFYMGVRASWIKYKYDISPSYTSTRIYILEGTYDIDKNRTLRIFFQHNSAVNKFNLYLNYQWEILPPKATLHLVFQKGLADFGEQSSDDQAIYTKFIYFF